jgi:hypothetical protein
MMLLYRQSTRLCDWTNAILPDTSMNDLDVVNVQQIGIVGSGIQGSP